ncbi:serine/threonine-protein kinase fhk [Acrasis kona]|uniref:Serine/threonine-protein kinase fhk n=1 Tax=Acrasis kona TaxID=1008807 RepID=A0AAW2ZCS9_9EUKA
MLVREVGAFRFELDKILGSGTFSKVYHGEDISTGFLVAVKVIDKKILRKMLKNNPSKSEFYFRGEVQILSDTHDENVIKLLYHTEDEDEMILVFERCDLSFEEYLELKMPKNQSNSKQKLAPKILLQEDEVRWWLTQLLKGLKALHSKSYLHRDLKPGNLLLKKTESQSVNNYESFIIKIADMGLGRHLEEGELSNSNCGTGHYKAPEIKNGSYRGLSSDLWSVGVILFRMITGAVCDSSRLYNLKARLQKRNFKLSDNCFDLLIGLLKLCPEKRITVNDALNHPFICQSTITCEETIQINEPRPESNTTLETISADELNHADVETLNHEAGDDEDNCTLESFEIVKEWKKITSSEKLNTPTGSFEYVLDSDIPNSVILIQNRAHDGCDEIKAVFFLNGKPVGKPLHVVGNQAKQFALGFSPKGCRVFVEYSSALWMRRHGGSPVDIVFYQVEEK